MDFLKKLLAKSGENIDKRKEQMEQSERAMLDKVNMALNPNIQGPEAPLVTDSEKENLEAMMPAVSGRINVAAQEATPLVKAMQKQIQSLPEMVKGPSSAVTPATLQEAKLALDGAKTLKEQLFANQRYSRLLDLFKKNKR